MPSSFSSFNSPVVPHSLVARLRMLPWPMVLLVAVIGMIGIAFLYSAGNMSWQPWAAAQAIRFILCFAVMLALAMVSVRTYLRFAYIFYAIILVLLVGVEIKGQIGMGAQRWLDLGIIIIQPSELMKIALALALARYFHGRPWKEMGRIAILIPPLIMIAVPVGLVLLQPNFGTAMLMILGSGAIFFAAGVRWWKFTLVIALTVAAVPITYDFVLHDYQRQRIDTFLDPSTDPRGSGYNIIQSQIALGSGGVTGKGFGLGTQSQLQFLPEKHTDFIFVVMAEEMGLIGALLLLALYGVVLFYALLIAIHSKNDFGRLTATGLMATIFLYVMANVAMVSGLIPVVGIPLPLISYGGTAMLTLMIACGILLSISLHRDLRIGRGGL